MKQSPWLHGGWYELPSKKLDGKPRVYFAFAAAVDVFKIGTSFDVRKRLRAIQACSPVPLTLLGVIQGGEQVERWCQYHCIESRSHDEWFRWDERTRPFVERLLRHGDNASVMFCQRELTADSLAAQGRPYYSEIPQLPYRSGEHLTYREVAKQQATPLVACSCDLCEES